MPLPPAHLGGIVRIAAVDPPGPTLTVPIGEKLPTFSSTGGWTFKGRPRRTGFVEYQGVDPYTLSIQVLLDGWATDTVVDPQLEVLRGLMRNRVGPRNEPAVLAVTGPSVPLYWLQWVMDDLATGDEIRNLDGQRVRCFIDLTFKQYIGADVLTLSSTEPATAAKARAGASPQAAGQPPATPGAKTYTVRSGDTLAGIAVATYGDVNRWHDIANLNGIRDPTKLTVGQTLRLP